MTRHADLMVVGRVATLAGSRWARRGRRRSRSPPVGSSPSGSAVDVEGLAGPRTRRLRLADDEIAIPGPHRRAPPPGRRRARRREGGARGLPIDRGAGGPGAGGGVRRRRLDRGRGLGSRRARALADGGRPRTSRSGPAGRPLGPRPSLVAREWSRPGGCGDLDCPVRPARWRDPAGRGRAPDGRPPRDGGRTRGRARPAADGRRDGRRHPGVFPGARLRWASSRSTTRGAWLREATSAGRSRRTGGSLPPATSRSVSMPASGPGSSSRRRRPVSAAAIRWAPIRSTVCAWAGSRRSPTARLARAPRPSSSRWNASRATPRPPTRGSACGSPGPSACASSRCAPPRSASRHRSTGSATPPCGPPWTPSRRRWARRR